MPRIIYQDKEYQRRESETVLDAMLRQGVSLPFSCRNGICHVCLMRCVAGNVEEHAQAGLKAALQEQGYFLPCRCRPQGDLEIAPPRMDDLYIQARVAEKDLLGSSICRLRLEPVSNFEYRPGQFLNLRHPDGITRSYSLASVPDDYFLELHIRRRTNGFLSNWIFDELRVDDEVEIHGPAGDNYYQAEDLDQPLLLLATGTGMAPVWGILREALARGHRGLIHLYHGSHDSEGLYLHAALNELQVAHANFHYHACVSGPGSLAGYRAARAVEAALNDHSSLRGWCVHLSGVPAMVYAGTDAVVEAGAAAHEVHADPFELTDLRQHDSAQAAKVYGRRAEDKGPGQSAPWKKPEVEFPQPDMALWAALENGALLSRILPDFYTRVYADARLSPFFKNVTKQRLIEKQYSFLKRAITGELCYFGERPRNAHHWMVISEELFDYRNSLLRQTARQHGLSEEWLRRWEVIEESFRPDIVKNSAWPRVVNGVEMGFDGFGEIVLDESSLCDSCEQEIKKGERVRYHLRTGETFCAACAEPKSANGSSS